MTLVPKWILIGLIIFSFIGFLDATFLTIEHFQQGPIQCLIFEGCDKVLTSSYAEIIGIPTALFGAIYYLTVFLVAIFCLDTGNKLALRFLAYFPLVGLIFSLWFVYLQFFVIKAICFYCMVSALTSTTLFILGLCLWSHLKRKTE